MKKVLFGISIANAIPVDKVIRFVIQENKLNGKYTVLALAQDNYKLSVYSGKSQEDCERWIENIYKD